MLNIVGNGVEILLLAIGLSRAIHIAASNRHNVMRKIRLPLAIAMIGWATPTMIKLLFAAMAQASLSN
jgi:hypothetical protein